MQRGVGFCNWACCAKRLTSTAEIERVDSEPNLHSVANDSGLCESCLSPIALHRPHELRDRPHVPSEPLPDRVLNQLNPALKELEQKYGRIRQRLRPIVGEIQYTEPSNQEGNDEEQRQVQYQIAVPPEETGEKLDDRFRFAALHVSALEKIMKVRRATHTQE